MCIQGQSLGYRSESELARKRDRGLDLRSKVYALREKTSFLCPGVIGATYHKKQDTRERSHAVIIRSEKGILGNMRFLASLRNDNGGGFAPFALSGITSTAVATYILAFALSSSIISANPRCHLEPQGRDLMQPSSAPRKVSSAT